MTKLRPPVSVEDALDRVVGRIGLAQAAQVVEKQQGTLRKWSDPDKPNEITLSAAFKLDAAYLASGGGCAPFLTIYEALLEGATERVCADAERVAKLAAEAAKETGQAMAAQFLASRPGASRADRLIAARETQDAIVALSATLPSLCGPEVPPPDLAAPG